MNCKQLSEVLDRLRGMRAEFDNAFNSAKTPKEADEAGLKLAEIIRLTRETLEPFETRLSDEQIRDAQEFYDFLRLPYSVEHLYKEGEMLLPSHREYERAVQEGYTEMIIMSPYIDFGKIYSTTGECLAREFMTIANSDEDDDEEVTPGIKNSYIGFQTVKKKLIDVPYIIMMKSDGDLGVAHNETMDKSPLEIEKLLEDYNNKPENDDMKLEGLWLEEYLMYQMQMYFKGKKMGIDFHPDTGALSYLLKEKSIDGACFLEATWGRFNYSINVGDVAEGNTSTIEGARLAVCPKSVRDYMEKKKDDM